MADQRGDGEAMNGPRPRRRDAVYRLWGWDRLRGRHLVRGGLLLGFSVLIAKLFIAGEMVRYMAPTLDPLTALTGIAMGLMGVTEIAVGSRHAQGHQHQGDAVEHVLTCILVILPLGLGLLVTPRALGAGALGGESVARLLLAYAPGPPRAEGGTPPAPPRPIADTADLLSYLQQAGLSGAGQRVRATGLALRAEGLGAGEFALLRYAIAHCVADARPLALLVATPGDRAPAADRWVEVEGVLAVTERDGSRLVTIAAERVRPIPEPPNPYLSAGF
jgi:uncharacterized repeat protein (TIGR03943 family)